MMTPSCQSDLAGSWSLREPASLLFDPEHHHPVRLVLETCLVTIGVLAIIRMFEIRPVPALRGWLTPGVLVTAGLVPTWITRRRFPPLGLDPDHLRLGLSLVGRICLVALPIAFLGQWVAVRLGSPIAPRPVFAERTDLLSWCLYQFLYVAVAEEVFFRGYLHANVMRLLLRRQDRSVPALRWSGIVISATCFALAHFVVQGRLVALLTFLPGLLLAWLFVRSRSLLAPMLFHGLANVAYGVIAMILT
jgi:membrane protease YdiL (CAAX protease family)